MLGMIAAPDLTAEVAEELAEALPACPWSWYAGWPGTAGPR
jgi:hypothetical protein